MQHATLTCGARRLRVLACEGGVERLRGLLGRPEPEPGVALLLDPCWAVHTVGMRYPIDVVFCDARWRVLRIVSALPPRRLAWTRGAVRALELAAHTARPLGLAVGARLQPDERLDPPDAARAPHVGAAVPFSSAPARALIGLAAVTVVAALLLGGCASPSARAFTAPPPTASRPAAPPLAVPPAGELRLQADIDYASRAWPLAEAGYRALLQAEPRAAEHWQRLGVVFLRTGRAREAVEALEAAARLRVPDTRTLQNLALAHLRAAADALAAAAVGSDTPAEAIAPLSPPALVAAPADRDSLRAAARSIEALLPPDLRAMPREAP